MEVLRTVADLKRARRDWGNVAFVPTMGALHPGHISLVERAKLDGLPVVVSIFVNPMQFNQAADLAAYPVQHEADLLLLEEASVSYVFMPTVDEMYPAPVTLQMQFGPVEQVLEGARRPGHFSGVGVVVSRLFHLVRPQQAYFGEKDLQQLAVVRRLVQDLRFDVEIIPVPTSRESDGLARSSRNQRLSAEARKLAPALQGILRQTWAMAHSAGISTALEHGRTSIEAAPGFTPEYLEAVNPYTFEVISASKAKPEGPFALCAAAWLDGVRLIDNVVAW